MTTTTADLDLKRYGSLLVKASPKVIKSEEENDHMLEIVESLMAKGENGLTPEEDALLELLANLIHDFESKAYPIPKSEPHEMLAFLLDQRHSSQETFGQLSAPRAGYPKSCVGNAQ